MANQSPNKRLRDGLNKQKSHLEDGVQRIRAWYSDDHDSPDDFRELEQPPHQSLLEESAALIESATRPLDGDGQETGRLERDAELILYGVGVEKLLTGIYLQLEPDKFIAHMDNQGGHTPPLGECKRPLLNDLGPDTPSEQHGMMKAMLNIIQEHRNNEVHLGFHRYEQSWLRRLILELTYILLHRYADPVPPEIESIKSGIIARRNLEIGNSLSIEFDIEGLE